MFVDEVTLTIEAGAGGDGKVSFFPKRGGPSGGNGGAGGDLYARVNLQFSDLGKYASVTHLAAEAGEPGTMNRRSGKDGEDKIIDLPRGTTIRDLDSGEEFELNDKDQIILLGRGGKGGRGNDAFKSPTNQTPRFAEEGEKGQLRHVKIILRLIADFGLIGLPNAGKSTLLNELTAAKAKIDSYPFTTLEPNLGVLDGLVLADIPGLIEGASLGRGLGIKFLKHIEKVKLLIHCISSESDNLIHDYQTVISEMEKHNPILLKKNSIVLLTKTDLIEKSEVLKKIRQLKKLADEVYPISILDEKSIAALRSRLIS